MQPGMRRFLPLILLAVVVLFLLPTLLKRHSSGLSSKDRTNLTIDASKRIDATEQVYRSNGGKYTEHLADLVALDPKLPNDLGIGLSVQLDASVDGKTYVAEVASDQLILVRSRKDGKLISNRCLTLKNGVSCPDGSTKPTKIVTTTTSK
jgi:hypothetical protein